jgi:hypothetical protein
MTNGLIMSSPRKAPVRLEAPDPVRGQREPWLDISFTVHNTSSRTLHVVASPTALDYDAVRRVLLLDFAQSRSPDDAIPNVTAVIPFRPPAFLELAPGEERILTTAVPVRIKRINPDGRPSITDLSDVQDVTVRLAYETSPFLPEPSASPKQARRQLQNWGTTLEATAPLEAAEGDNNARRR